MSQNPESELGDTIGTRSAPVVIVPLDNRGVPKILRSFVAAADPVCHFEAINTVEDGLSRSLGTPILVVVTAPTVSLARAIGSGLSASAALQAWIADTESQLVQIRKARRQVVLLDRDGIVADPAACAGLLNDRLNLRVAEIPADVAETRDHEPAFLSLLARLLLDCDPHARAIADEFEATMSGPVISTAVSAEKIDQAFSETRGLEIENGTLRAERNPLIADMRHVQDQLEQTQMDAQLAKAAGEANRQKVEKQERFRRRRETALGALLLAYSTEIGSCHKKLAESEKALGDIRTELETARSSLREKEAALTKSQASLFRKMTRSLRAANTGGKQSGK